MNEPVNPIIRPEDSLIEYPCAFPIKVMGVHVETFVDTVVAHGGRRLRLLANYRSVPDILNAVERLVAPIMIRRRGVQPQYRIPGRHLQGRWNGSASREGC